MNKNKFEQGYFYIRNFISKAVRYNTTEQWFKTDNIKFDDIFGRILGDREIFLDEIEDGIISNLVRKIIEGE